MIYLLRIALALLNAGETEATHERAHVMCEAYVAIAFNEDDSPAGETLAWPLCRVDGSEIVETDPEGY